MNPVPSMTPSIRIHLATTIASGVGFVMACSSSSGWFLPLICYLFALVSLFSLFQRLGAVSQAQKTFLWLVNLTATPAFIATLWFSGKLSQLF